MLPLHRAAHHGQLDIVEFLLSEIHPRARPAVLDAPTKLGYTAHMLACESGHTELAQLLVWQSARRCGARNGTR